MVQLCLFKGKEDSSFYFYGKAVQYNPFRFRDMIHPVADHYYYNKRYTEAKPFYRLAFNFATFTRNRDLERLIEILIIEQDYTEARATLNKFLKQEADPVHYKKLLDLIINASGNR